MYTENYQPADHSPWPIAPSRSVLVVEDDAAIRESLLSVLIEEGFEVYEASDGIEAMNLLVEKKIRPNLILLDMVMPHMGGAEFLEAMSKERELAHLPVALLSAAKVEHPNPLAVVSLAKPIEIEDLLSVVHRFADQPLAIAADRICC